MEAVIYTLPSWTLAPLFNNDYTGMSDEDEEALEKFLGALPNDVHKIPIGYTSVGFRRVNDVQKLGCDCYDVSFPIICD